MAEKRKIKVLFLIDGLLVGGAEKSLLEIVREFRTTEPVFCHIYPDKPLKPVYEAAGVRVISLDIQGRYAFLAAYRNTLAVVRAEQPDLIHATLYRAGIVSRMIQLRTGLPLINSFVSESYGPIRYRGLSRVAAAKRSCLKWLDRLTANRADRFIANSATIKASNCHYLNVPEAMVNVVYRGRNLEDFRPAEAMQMDDLRDSLRLSPEERIVLCVGRFWPPKRQQDLLRALPSVLQRIPHLILIFAGDGAGRRECELLAEDLGVGASVRFLGLRHDVPQLLRLADLVVTPSEYEGLPGAVIEAMLAGKPVVLSRIAVHEEMVENRVDGLFFTLYDAEDLADRIVEVLSDRELAERLGRNAGAKARELYDVRITAARYEELYRDVLEECDRG